MKKMGTTFPYAVEAVVFFTCACSYTMDTFQYEYIYQVVSEELNYTSNHSVEYCSPNQSQSIRDRAVADQVSKWTMYSSVSSFIPCMFGASFLTSWSDKIGRGKAIAFPVMGTLIAAILQLAIIVFRFPLFCLMVSGFLYGASGTYSALLNIGTAYLSDTVSPENRGKRFTILEVSASLGGGMVQIATGYWMQASGFIPPSIFIVACAVSALFFIPLLSSKKKSDKNKEHPFTANDQGRQPLLSGNEIPENNDDVTPSTSSGNPHDKELSEHGALLTQLKIVWNIYTTEARACDTCKLKNESGTKMCNHPGCLRNGRIWRLWFYALSFSIYMFAVNGISLFRTMFLVSYPVCFTPDLVGAQAGLTNGLIIGAPFAILFLQNFIGLGGQSIVLIGILARVVSCIMMGFARGPLLVFMATSLGVLYNFTTAFMRSETSRLVSPTEQGSALAVYSGLESFINIFSPITFLSLYPLTLHISHGFSFVIAALIFGGSLTLMLSVWIANKTRLHRRTGGEGHFAA